MALILETKVMDLIEVQEEKRKVLGVGEKSNIWIGFAFDYYIPSFFSSEPTGLYFNIFSYNIFEPMVFLSFRNIGSKRWDFKPFQFYIFTGGFLEINASYSEIRQNEGLDNYQKNASFLIAGGPSFGGGFSVMIPKANKDGNKKEIFGLGLESINNFNIPYFANDYAYEYFYQQFINLLFHIIPSYKIKTDVILGLNLAIGNESYDPSKKAILSKLGIVIGARFKIDIHNFYKVAKLF